MADEIVHPENYQSIFESRDAAIKHYMEGAAEEIIGPPSPDTPYVIYNGTKFYMGVTNKDPKIFGSFPKLKPARMDPKDWKELSLRHFVNKVYNQNPNNSCVGHGVVAGYSIAHRIAGLTNQIFSPCFNYGLINGGSDNGASVGAGVRTTAEVGTCLESTVGPMQIWRSRWPQSAFTEAKRFQTVSSEALSDFVDIGTALMYGRPVPFGVYIGQRFNPDSEGFVPDLGGSVRGTGHCMLAIGLKFARNRWWVEVLNSWGRWGLNGFCYMPQSYFDSYLDFLEAYAFRISGIDPQDAHKPLVTA